MGRADRLMDLLDLLRSRELVTIECLAETLQVSRRTIMRDLATLRRRGWAVEAATGPGGGVWLRRSTGLRVVQLSDPELVALWMAGRIALQSGFLPWREQTRLALARLLTGLPNARARLVRQLNDRVIVDDPVSREVTDNLGEVLDDVVATVEVAFAKGRCLAFTYVDGQRRQTERVVEPHGLLVRSPAWYLLTRDVHKDAARMFRMDRISNARVCEEQGFLPDIGALHAMWIAQEAIPTGAASSR